MKLGIFSDVHGNLEALAAVLDFLRNQEVTEYVCLGDIVGYGADPDECVRRIRELRACVVAGNHDHAAVRQTPLETFNDVARRALLWTRQRLTPDSQAYLRALELVEFLPAHSFRLVHGSPSAPRAWHYIESWSDVEYELGFFSDRACLVGHSHVPFVACGDTIRHRVPIDEVQARRITELEFELPNQGAKFLLNVGSVGQPRDGDPRACVVTFTPRTHRMQFHRVEYDIAAAQRKIRAAGLPEILAYRLTLGQ